MEIIIIALMIKKYIFFFSLFINLTMFNKIIKFIYFSLFMLNFYYDVYSNINLNQLKQFLVSSYNHFDEIKFLFIYFFFYKDTCSALYNL